MRFALVTMLILAVSQAPPPADAPAKPVSAAEAVKSVGKPAVTVEMRVVKAKDRLQKRGVVFLDSEGDPDHADNLGVAISVGAAAEFAKQGVADFEKHFAGKTIRVTGCVMNFEKRPYLPVLEAKQVEVVKTP